MLFGQSFLAVPFGLAGGGFMFLAVVYVLIALSGIFVRGTKRILCSGLFLLALNGLLLFLPFVLVRLGVLEQRGCLRF